MWRGGAPFDNSQTPGIDFLANGAPRVDVANNGYFMGPFLYNCRNNPLQRVLWKAAQRAILFTHTQGVTNVASNRNDNDEDPSDYMKSFSSYGIGVAYVAAPSGDSVFGRTAEVPNGRVLTTYPAD